jgi:hypothetical protein
MKSTVDIEIRAPRAEHLANPQNNPNWMDDLESIEELSGRCDA